MQNQIMYPHDMEFRNALSVSQIHTYSKCRRAWKYSYIDHLSKKYERPYMTKGKLAHAGMEKAFTALYECQNQGKQIRIEDMISAGITHMRSDFDTYIKDLGLDAPLLWSPEDKEMVINLEQMFDDAVEVFERTLKSAEPLNYEVLYIQGFPAIELHWAIPIRGDKFMHGFIDLVVRDIKTRQIWSIDWKFKSQLSAEEDEAFNIQNSIYCKALRMAGISVTGSITYQALNVPTTLPNLNKNGTVSRAKIRCTWDDYAAFCRQVGQDPEDYREEMEPKLSEITWVRPIKEYRSEYMMYNIWEKVVKTLSSEINVKRNNKKYPPALNAMNCKSCAYTSLCQAELRGYDTEFIINSEYVNKHSEPVGEEVE